MITGWIVAVVAVLGVVGLLFRISFQVGGLVQKFGDHVSDSDRVHVDQEDRLRRLERRPASGGHV